MKQPPGYNMLFQRLGDNRPRPVLLALSLTAICIIIGRNMDGNVLSLNDTCAANFLRQFTLHDNRHGKMASYNLSNPNATDYSGTGDKSTRILKHLNGLVRIYDSVFLIICDK